MKNNKIKNDLSELNLTGKVASISETKYKTANEFGDVNITDFNELGNKIEERVLNYSNGNLQCKSKSIYKYDSQNNKIEDCRYILDNRDVKFTFKFDEKGNKIEVCFYNSNDELKSTDTYKYDDNGYLIEQNNFINNQLMKFLYKYDDKGNRIELKGYNSDGSLDYKSTSKYDDKGNKIEVCSYNGYVKLTGKNTYKYDDKDFLIEQVTENNFKTKHIYKYDDKGNMIEDYNIFLDMNGGIKNIFKYDYDEMGNWVKKIEFKKRDLLDKDGIPQETTARTIKYY